MSLAPFRVTEARALRDLDNRALAARVLTLLGEIAFFYCNNRATAFDRGTVEGVRAIADRLFFFTTFHRDGRAASAASDARGACITIARTRPCTPHVRALATRAAFAAAELALRFPALRPRGRLTTKGTSDVQC